MSLWCTYIPRIPSPPPSKENYKYIPVIPLPSKEDYKYFISYAVYKEGYPSQVMFKSTEVLLKNPIESHKDIDLVVKKLSKVEEHFEITVLNFREFDE